MRCLIRFAVIPLLLASFSSLHAEKPKRMTEKDYLELIIEVTKPLKHKRGGRLPLYVWASRINSISDEEEIERLLKALDERGIAVLVSWGNPKGIEQALRVGKIQKKLGLMVNVDATGAVYSFCDGSEETAHVDKAGKRFFDMSFAGYRKMGCPFALKQRYEPMRQKLEPFLKGYKEAGVPMDFWAADWEIDGPIEWNDAWKNSKNCTRCQANIENIDNFKNFQNALRRIRSHMQNEVFCKTIKKFFPKALIGNYGANPHGGHRYWYDYFEKEVKPDLGYPGQKDQNAFYRTWAHEFEGAGYTYAMPVVYTWYQIFNWYPEFENTDYRWFYNLLLVGSNVGKHTPKDIPIIPFVHWHTTAAPKEGVPGLVDMSENAYKELLWHLLLRGHDTLIMWCPRNELADEVRPLQEVYADSLEFAKFLENGKPVIFDVPKKQGAVVSAVRLKNQLLVRRTDFGDAPRIVKIEIDGKMARIPRTNGKCKIIKLEKSRDRK